MPRFLNYLMYLYLTAKMNNTGYYLTKVSSNPGAGDILMGFLGSVILSFAFSMFQQRKVNKWFTKQSLRSLQHQSIREHNYIWLYCAASKEACGRDIHLCHPLHGVFVVFHSSHWTSSWSGAIINHINSSQMHNRGTCSQHCIFLWRFIITHFILAFRFNMAQTLR